jgi:hypothetical protein
MKVTLLEVLIMNNSQILSGIYPAENSEEETDAARWISSQGWGSPE